jgi:hypothetical protein
MGGVGIVPPILNVGTKLKVVVSVKLRWLYSRGDTLHKHCVDDWVGPRDGTETCPCRELNQYSSVVQPVMKTYRLS